ncbi:MAG: hypothetical protein JWM98_128 [Thermoleophilia bacterium]|nr:hypothetical protein [Thermoleophilia bacterium]
MDPDSPVRLTIVRNEPEAELVCGLLRAGDVRCMHRITDLAFGSGGELPTSGAGAREVLVMPRDHERAQALLAELVHDADEPST